MSMERHRCKLCSRIFSNGRALGGHMRSHLATLPLPPKKKKEQVQVQLGDESTESDSSSTQSAELEHVDVGGSNNKEEKGAGGYILRENPKRSLKASDPEFLDAGSVVVQDRESETESTQNPTRRRSKRASQRVFGAGGSHSQSQTTQLTHENDESNKKLKTLVKSESVTESTPLSSVSDASQDEEVALCLMMLSRDAWVRRNDININIHKVRSQQQENEEEDKSVEDTNDSATELKLTRAKKTMKAAKFKCLGCKKVFRTNRALSGHKASNKECQQQEMRMNCGGHHPQILEDHKIYECPFCYKVFGSGQALGGHKRAHLLASSSNPNSNNNNNNNVISSSVGVDHKGGDTTSFVLDLNLPAPVEDDHDSQLGFL